MVTKCVSLRAEIDIGQYPECIVARATPFRFISTFSPTFVGNKIFAHIFSKMMGYVYPETNWS